jgi:hypothetical protein
MNAFLTIASIFSSPALHGNFYLDPGSGSFILQLLIAGLVGGAFLLKTYWQKIIAFFRNRTSKQPDDIEK